MEGMCADGCLGYFGDFRHVKLAVGDILCTLYIHAN